MLRFLFASSLLLLSGCALDWDYPTGAGGGGGVGAGGQGGEGGAAQPSIQILSPDDMSTLSHNDLTSFRCVVSNFDAPADAVEWRSSVTDTAFGAGCDFLEHLATGEQTITARLLSGGTELDSDAVQVTVTP